MKYFGGFNDRLDVAFNFQPDDGNILYRSAIDRFQIPEDFPTEEEILFASYGGGSYDGDAIVIFEKGGKVFEVHGSHCSCYGLEGQWAPEETTWLAIRLRPREGYGNPMYDHEEEAGKVFWDLVDSRTSE